MSGASFVDLGIAIRPNGPIEQRLPCPRCDRGARDDALGVNIESGAFHCFRCGWSGRADLGETRAAAPVQRLDDPERARRVRERIERIWSETVDLENPKARPVRSYLAARGLQAILVNPPAVLRAHPGVAYFDTATRREIGVYPAMIAAFHDPKGGRVTLHATFLRQDGCAKAPVPSPKKIMGVARRGATKGGAIRLYSPHEGRLGIAEGIESALSMYLIRLIPTWASFCADNLARVSLPPGLTKLEIGVDVDESGKGQQAAKALAARVRAMRPDVTVSFIKPDHGKDLNDELLHARAS